MSTGWLVNRGRRIDKYNRNRGRRKEIEDVNVIGVATVEGGVGRNRITSSIQDSLLWMTIKQHK